MRLRNVLTCTAASVVCVTLASFSHAELAPRTAEAIIADYNSPDLAHIPFDDSQKDDQTYRAEYLERMNVRIRARNVFVKELYDVDPSNPMLPDMLQFRWWQQRRMKEPGVDAEVAQMIADNRSPVSVAAAKKEKAKADGLALRNEAIGKPFEFSFKDAINGNEVSNKTLKGKILVIDFWATWCGPCVAEMPHMKELYATFKDQGVEFVGVSLDDPEETRGGLTKLKAYVAKNEVPWPQYYQGNGWDGELNTKWGVTSIPALFVIDQDGKVASTSARGQLETILPQLIAKRTPAASVTP